MLDFGLVKKIFFAGIGGIGMSAAAGIAKELGYEVSGADDYDIYQPSKGVLDRNGITYKIGYRSENLPEDTDLLVTSPGISYDSPEVKKAAQYQIPIISFAELLGHLTADKKRIVVVGTHGKGTTSGLIAYALKKLENASFFVGAVLNDLQTNYHLGTGSHFVLEGDEYKANFNDNTPKFQYLKPDLLLINNIEWDHPDLYPDLAAFKAVFIRLVSSLSPDALLVFNSDDQNVREITAGFKGKKVGYGFLKNSQVRGYAPVAENGFFKMTVAAGGKQCVFETSLPGLLYAHNILAATTVLIELGYKPDKIAPLVKEYSGVVRRYQVVYDREISIVDDYAHHPSAVRQTLEATRQKYPGRRIVCFFEPHTFSRTKETLPDLSKAFAAADLVFIAEVYPAREQRLQSSITGIEVTAAIAAHHHNVYFVSHKHEALEQFKKIVRPGDVVVVMAVGSFNTLVYDLISAYANRK